MLFSRLDIFIIFEKIRKYTHVTNDVLVFLETIMRSTNSPNIRVATNKLTKLTRQTGELCFFSQHLLLLGAKTLLFVSMP